MFETKLKKLGSFCLGLMVCVLPFMQALAATSDSESGFSITQTIDQVSSGTESQSYVFSYTKDKEAKSYDQGTKVHISLDEGFELESVKVGNWEGYNGTIRVELWKDGEIQKYYDASQESKVSYKEFHKGKPPYAQAETTGSNRIFGSSITAFAVTASSSSAATVTTDDTTSYYDELVVYTTESTTSVYSFSGLQVSGTLNTSDTSGSVKLKASYVGYSTSEDGSTEEEIVDEDDVETVCQYYNLETPTMTCSKSELDYGDEFLATVSGVKGSGNVTPKWLEIVVYVPTRLTVKSVTLPEFDNGTATLYVNGSSMKASNGTVSVGKTITSFIVKVACDSEEITQTKDMKITLYNKGTDEEETYMRATVSACYGDESYTTTESSDKYDLKFSKKPASSSDSSSSSSGSSDNSSDSGSGNTGDSSDSTGDSTGSSTTDSSGLSDDDYVDITNGSSGSSNSSGSSGNSSNSTSGSTSGTSGTTTGSSASSKTSTTTGNSSDSSSTIKKASKISSIINTAGLSLNASAVSGTGSSRFSLSKGTSLASATTGTTASSSYSAVTDVTTTEDEDDTEATSEDDTEMDEDDVTTASESSGSVSRLIAEESEEENNSILNKIKGFFGNRAVQIVLILAVVLGVGFFAIRALMSPKDTKKGKKKKKK